MEHGVSLNTDCLPSDRERKVHYRKAGIYVPPKQVTLSSGHNAYFAPLQNLLTNLLKHPEITTHVKARLEPSEDSVMNDFKDGAYFLSHTVVECHRKNVLTLNLYCNDLEIVNPIGAKQGNKGNLTVFYSLIETSK